MSHLAHELHMPLTPPVMRRPGTERKPRPPGGAGRERAGERARGARSFVGPAPPRRGLKPLRVGEGAPGAGINSHGLRKQSIQTSTPDLVHTEAGRGGGAAVAPAEPQPHPAGPARPAPPRRTCDRCAGAPRAAEPRGAPAAPRPPDGAGTRPPRRRRPSGALSPSQAPGRPGAAAPASRPPALT